MNNSIEGLAYDRISVILVPSVDVRQSSHLPRNTSILSIQVSEESKGHLIGLLSLLILLLPVTNLAQYFWLQRKK